MRVAVVVLTFQGREDTLRCLASLRGARGVDAVIVVDNASTDGTVEAVRDRYPEIEVLAQPNNVGFAEGNNIGIRHAMARGATHVLIANNDTRFAHDTVARMLAVADTNPEAGIVCPLIRYEHAPDRIWYAGRTFDPRRGYHGRPWGWMQVDRGQFSGVHEVDTGTGCAMLMPVAAIERVGLMDPDLFLYLEDTDWSLRFRAAGYKVLVAGDAVLWHRAGAAGGGEANENTHYYETRNTLVVCARYATLPCFRASLRELECVVTHLVHVRRGDRRLRGVRAVLHGWRDYHADRLGPRA